MKKFKLLFPLLFISALSAEQRIYEGKETSKLSTKREKLLSNGGYSSQESFENLTSSGVLKLKGTTVSNKLIIQGCLIAQSAHLGSIEGSGDINLTDTTVKLESSIMGYLRAQHTTFNSPLTISSNKAVFTASKLNAITVKKLDSFKCKQVIELKQKTMVEGPIIFESGKGEVHLYSGSKVFTPVTGGKIIHKN
jgi:hypothetical protein